VPFWFCRDCNEIIPAKKESLPIDPTKTIPPVDKCPKCGSKNINPSEDVCDCWVDSSVTPLIITGYFGHEKYFEQAYPVTMREQGHDIIRTWLFYTTFRCLMLTNEEPFKEVLVNGHILGPDGYRMSKSRGNVISPEERLDEFGADSLRQALLSLTIGSDFPFKWEVVKYNKAFLQKYWSASRFAHQFINDYNLSFEENKD
ncbi:MAG: valyl-tRNA synthetase, partial [Thermoproteota archaeon]|nr:valyl-tRNA synthetase [Thermoproteota archaeon]